MITAVDGKRVTSSDDLSSAIGAKRPGDTISITYSRAGAKEQAAEQKEKRRQKHEEASGEASS